MASNAKYLTLTQDNFRGNVLESSKPVLVDFWADWCAPCHAIAPVIEELTTEFAGRVKVGKLDIDHNPAVATQYGIRSIPTLLVFKGGRVVESIVGVTPKKVLADKLNALLELQPA